MPNAEKPNKEMLENLDLLLNFDLLKSEKDWDLIKVLRKMNSMEPKDKPKEPVDGH
jgi:hypothetical protein